jgi:hypothetical protein
MQVLDFSCAVPSARSKVMLTCVMSLSICLDGIAGQVVTNNPFRVTFIVPFYEESAWKAIDLDVVLQLLYHPYKRPVCDKSGSVTHLGQAAEECQKASPVAVPARYVQWVSG